MKATRKNVGRGFTLIETLVALVVLSVGLLGAVALLLGSLRGQADARRSHEATGLLRDAADRLRANGAICAATSPVADCDPANLAAFERARFEAAANLVFSGDATVSIDFAPATGAAPARYMITLRLAEAAGVNVLSLQVHAPALVAG